MAPAQQVEVQEEHVTPAQQVEVQEEHVAPAQQVEVREESPSDGEEVAPLQQEQVQSAEEAPQGKEMEHFLCEDADVVGRLTVVVNKEGKTQNIKVAYNKSNTGQDVFQLLQDYYSLEKGTYQLKWTADGSSTLTEYDGLFSYFGASGRLVCSLLLKGGGARNIYLKKTEAIAILKKRVQANVRKSDDMFDMEKLPEQVKSFADGIVNEVGKMKLLQSQGVSVVRAVLAKCSNTALDEIEEIASGTGRKGNGEERVARIITQIYPSIIAVEQCRVSLDGLQEQVMEDLMGVFINEYHSYADGNPARMDFAAFAHDVSNVKKDRDPNSQVQMPNSGSCALM